MTGASWAQARKNSRLSQAEVARQLGVTQPYVSMVERGERNWPARLLRKAVRVYVLSPSALPMETRSQTPAFVSQDELTRDLSALGYPGFAHVRSHRTKNPAEVLLTALAQPDLDSRLTEALPWLVLAYVDLDWQWLVRSAKIHDLQNRLGFVTGLARRLAEMDPAGSAKAELLAQRESELERSRLEREDTLCKQSLTSAERRWLEKTRPPEAARWHLLTDLSTEHLNHVGPNE